MSQDVGGMPPPEGVTPDFDGSSPLQKSIVIIYSCTFTVATILLMLRLYTGIVIVRKLDWDIPLIILSWGGSMGFFIGVMLAIPSGFGKHLWDVRATSLNGYFQLLLVLGLTYVWPPTLAKLAILVLYYRLIPNRGFRWAIYGTAAGLIIYTIVFTILLAWPCYPLKPGTTACVVNLTVAQGVLNIVSDGIVIALPIPLIHRLNMPLRQRITAGLLLALGSAVVVVSCIRFGYVKKMEDNPDVTWTQASTSQWSCIEMNTGIICNCLAHLKPFVRKHLPFLSKFVTRGSSNMSHPTDRSQGRSHKWRGDKASHKYELHSVGRAHQPDLVDNEPGIVVVDEVQVEFTPSKDNGDTSSTDDILRNTR
ncbi:hypothetical protein FG05_03151 [Fusarium graminearum]|nr:hypothetical protein FG05_03151 [Fusarium graminearum]